VVRSRPDIVPVGDPPLVATACDVGSPFARGARRLDICKHEREQGLRLLESTGRYIAVDGASSKTQRLCRLRALPWMRSVQRSWNVRGFLASFAMVCSRPASLFRGVAGRHLVRACATFVGEACFRRPTDRQTCREVTPNHICLCSFSGCGPCPPRRFPRNGGDVPRRHSAPPPRRPQREQIYLLRERLWSL